MAVIGPCADDERLLQGDYSYPAHTEIVQPRDHNGQLIERAGDFAPGPYYPDSITPLGGIRAIARHVTYTRGAGIRSTSTDGFVHAVADAYAADVAVCFVGGRSGSCPTAPAVSFATRATWVCPACNNSSSKPSSRRGRRLSWS